MTAKSLATRGILPGRQCTDGWETTLEEIENWYAKLSGQEWADLATGGRIDPLITEIVLEGEVPIDRLLAVLRSSEENNKVKIVSHDLEQATTPEIVLFLLEAAETGRKGMESLEHAMLTESMHRQIELAYKCEEIVGKNPVRVTLSNQKTLILKIENTMAELPQREREIIKFYLTNYALKLSRKLQQNRAHS